PTCLRDMFSPPRSFLDPSLPMKVLAGALPLVTTVPQPVPVPRTAHLDEAGLCEKAMRGERDAWNVLVQRHNHRVVLALLARGVRIDRAKDIAQEAWMRLVEQQRLGRLARLQLPGLAIAQATFLALEAARREHADRRHHPIDEPAIAAALTDPHDD